MGYAAGTLEEYLADAASNKPAPGGGSVSALVGALAASMSEMAANFTVGKNKFASVQEQVAACLGRLEPCRRELLRLMDADVEAYEAVGAAYGMPRQSDEQKAARDEAVQRALKDAMEVPLSIVRECRVVAEMAAELVRIANPNLITDVGVSVILAEAACAAARLNVEVNLKYIKDESIAGELRPELDEIEQITAQYRRAVCVAVQDHLSG